MVDKVRANPYNVLKSKGLNKKAYLLAVIVEGYKRLNGYYKMLNGRFYGPCKTIEEATGAILIAGVWHDYYYDAYSRDSEDRMRRRFW